MKNSQYFGIWEINKKLGKKEKSKNFCIKIGIVSLSGRKLGFVGMLMSTESTELTSYTENSQKKKVPLKPVDLLNDLSNYQKRILNTLILILCVQMSASTTAKFFF